jgi:hypothetical protein
VCRVCQQARRAATWCEACQAPEVWPENLPVLELFLQALPAYRTTGLDRVAEGFDRAEVWRLMDLNDVPAAERGERWAALYTLEQELAGIRAAKASAPARPPHGHDSANRHQDQRRR